jgi:hypothetical protein
MSDTSLLGKYLEGWGFRSTTPRFEPGEEFDVFLTGVRDGVPVARVGDTTIEVPDAPVRFVDDRVAVRVTEFDDATHTGTATFLERTGESAF